MQVPKVIYEPWIFCWLSSAGAAGQNSHYVASTTFNEEDFSLLPASPSCIHPAPGLRFGCWRAFGRCLCFFAACFFYPFAKDFYIVCCPVVPCCHFWESDTILSSIISIGGTWASFSCMSRAPVRRPAFRSTPCRITYLLKRKRDIFSKIKKTSYFSNRGPQLLPSLYGSMKVTFTVYPIEL